MKRDMDLLRSVLFFIEENYKAGSGTSLSIHIDGYDETVATAFITATAEGVANAVLKNGGII